MQYRPSSTIRRSPSTWPLIRARRFPSSSRRASPIVTRRGGTVFAVCLAMPLTYTPTPYLSSPAGSADSFVLESGPCNEESPRHEQRDPVAFCVGGDQI